MRANAEWPEVTSDRTRYCGLRADRLRGALADTTVLDALLVQLGAPVRPALFSEFGVGAKRSLVAARVAAHKRTESSPWFGIDEAEIVAASIWTAVRLGDREVHELFSASRVRADLLAPVCAWLQAKGFDAFADVPLRRQRADLFGAPALAEDESPVAIELLEEREELGQALERMAIWGRFAGTVYLACTPAAVAEQLNRRFEGRGVTRWEPDALYRRITQLGHGLLIVDDGAIDEVIVPEVQPPCAAALVELEAALVRAPRIGPLTYRTSSPVPVSLPAARELI
jgi:hypothetical protein